MTVSRRQVLTGTIAVAAASVLPSTPEAPLTFGPIDPNCEPVGCIIYDGKLWAGIYDKAGKLIAQSAEVEVKAADHSIALNVPDIDVWQTGEMEIRINRGEHAIFTFDKPITVVSGDSLRIRDLMIELT